MALDASNSSSLEQLALKGLTHSFIDCGQNGSKAEFPGIAVRALNCTSVNIRQHRYGGTFESKTHMPMTTKRSKSKPEVKFQYGGRLIFSKTEVAISQPWIEVHVLR